MYFQWESLKAALHLSAKPSKLSGSKSVGHLNNRTGIATCFERRNRDTDMEADLYFPKVSRKSDAFSLGDYTVQSLAQQLTLMEQVI